MKIVLVSREKQEFANLVTVLQDITAVEITQLTKKTEVLDFLQDKKINVLVVADQLADTDGLDLVQHISKNDPFINCCLVSNLTPEEFHEKTEGLGVLMQLPAHPGRQEAMKMIEILESINVLLSKNI